ncbi:MAG: galactose-1-phosphate uridylyltransferase [Pseudomonadota bacterium]|nr:galactose-1-phosphate uridylyltransferase [Pseudomonadota bacterium]
MNQTALTPLAFQKREITARIIEPDGSPAKKPIEIRTDPVTGRNCRITFARAKEAESGESLFPEPPPGANHTASCPFCRPQLYKRTPMLAAGLAESPRLEYGEAVLFPNLFPYGRYSAVSVFDNHHFVEIGTASPKSYADCFINCSHYLKKVQATDNEAVYLAITQNHLPSAGGSLIHPHLQVHADRIPANISKFLKQCTADYYAKTGHLLFSDYLVHEQEDANRLIGRTGDWHWLAAFAPEGFYEIWAILPGVVSLQEMNENHWHDLAAGVINTQKFYRSLNHNGYNLGLSAVEQENSRLEMRLRILVRSNFDQWSRNDHTGFEVMLGDMATFSSPEQTAEMAGKFWQKK